MTATRSQAVTKIVTKEVKDLTDSEYRRCKQHNLRSEGYPYASMRPQLETCRKNETGWATFYYIGRRCAGWALTWEVSWGRMKTYFYVRPEFRRQGVGTKLHHAVRAQFGPVQVVPWDTRSREFFSAVGATERDPWC